MGYKLFFIIKVLVCQEFGCLVPSNKVFLTFMIDLVNRRFCLCLPTVILMKKEKMKYWCTVKKNPNHPPSLGVVWILLEASEILPLTVTLLISSSTSKGMNIGDGSWPCSVHELQCSFLSSWDFSHSNRNVANSYSGFFRATRERW